MTRRLALAIGLVFAIIAAQAPEFAQQYRQRLGGALDELPTGQRNVIELAYFGGCTHTEIAAMLSLPVGTVKGRMRLGLTRLRIAFGDPADAIA